MLMFVVIDALSVYLTNPSNPPSSGSSTDLSVSVNLYLEGGSRPYWIQVVTACIYLAQALFIADCFNRVFDCYIKVYRSSSIFTGRAQPTFVPTSLTLGYATGHSFQFLL